MRRRFRLPCLLSLILLSTGCLPGGEETSQEQAGSSWKGQPVPEGSLPRQVIPESCSLRLEILPEMSGFTGQAEIVVAIREPVERIWLHGQDLEVRSVEVLLEDGEQVTGRYTQVHPDGISVIELPSEVQPGAARIRIGYSGRFAEDASGLFRTESGGDWYVFSEFQPIQARQAFPGFDEPAFKIPYDIEIVTRRDYVALSNTRQREEELTENDLKRVRFEKTPPLPSYLVAFAVGPLDVVEGPPVPPGPWREQSVRVRGVAAKGKGAALDYALANTAVMVEALEQYFEIPYPYDKLDLVAVPGYAAAMENAGLIFYSEYLLLMEDSPSIRQQESFGATHAHELAHQWLGNLVTMAWWDDLWLNEAFANWMAEKVMAVWRPELRYGRQALASVFRTMDSDSLASARSVREPVRDSAGMFAAFDDLTYVKGAAVLTMVENYLGAELFRQGLKLHLERFSHATADVFDLVDSLETVAGEDQQLEMILRSYLFQPGVPLVSAALDCAGAEATVRLSQKRYLPLGAVSDSSGQWSIPVCMSWGGVRSEARAEQCLLLSEQSREISLGAGCPAWLMPNRGAAGYYRWEVERDNMAFLVASGQALDTLERMSLADSLAAMVRSGSLGLDEYLVALPDLAAALERSVSLAPAPEIRRILDYLVKPDQYAEARAYFGAIYGRRLEFLDRPGGAEASPEEERFRFELTRFLAEDARDADVRRRLEDAARAYEEADGKSADREVEPDLVGTMLAVGVQELGEEFFDKLLDDLAGETSAARRRDLIYAVGKAGDPLLAARARNL
ncbi:MAG: M1 family metallopeptidase, partial [Gammaproteobacteria bacterium]